MQSFAARLGLLDQQPQPQQAPVSEQEWHATRASAQQQVERFSADPRVAAKLPQYRQAMAHLIQSGQASGLEQAFAICEEHVAAHPRQAQQKAASKRPSPNRAPRRRSSVAGSRAALEAAWDEAEARA